METVLKVQTTMQDVINFTDEEIDSLQIGSVYECWACTAKCIFVLVMDNKNTEDEPAERKLERDELIKILGDASKRLFTSLRLRGYFSPTELTKRKSK